MQNDIFFTIALAAFAFAGGVLLAAIQIPPDLLRCRLHEEDERMTREAVAALGDPWEQYDAGRLDIERFCWLAACYAEAMRLEAAGVAILWPRHIGWYVRRDQWPEPGAVVRLWPEGEDPRTGEVSREVPAQEA